jgi:hypothetical protein
MVGDDKLVLESDLTQTAEVVLSEAIVNREDLSRGPQ